MCMFDAHPYECGNIYSQGQLNLVPAFLLFSPPRRLEESLRQYRFAARMLKRHQGGAWGNKASAEATFETHTHARSLTQIKELQFELQLVVQMQMPHKSFL